MRQPDSKVSPRRRLRLRLGWLLLAIAVGTPALAWFTSPLLRGRVYLFVGRYDQAWHETRSAQGTEGRAPQLVRILNTEVIDGLTYQQARRAEDLEELRSEEWWAALDAPPSLPVALQNDRLRAVLAQPQSPSRDEELAAILDEPLGVAKDVLGTELRTELGLWPDETYTLGHGDRPLWEAEPWWVTEPWWEAEFSEWIHWGCDARTRLATHRARPEIVAALESADVSRLLAAIEQHPELLQDAWGDAPMEELFDSVWMPNATRDRFFGQLLDHPSGPKRDLMLHYLLQARTLPDPLMQDPRAPDWMRLGESGFALERFLAQFETWPLGTCPERVTDPLESLWNQAYVGILEGLTRRNETWEAEAIHPEILRRFEAGRDRRLEVLRRFEARGDRTLAYPYLVCADLVAQLPCQSAWQSHAYLFRLGHWPTPNQAGREIHCLRCGATSGPAWGVELGNPYPIGRDEPWSAWPPEDRSDREAHASDMSMPWNPGAPIRRRLAPLLRELPDWPWYRCSPTGGNPTSAYPASPYPSWVEDFDDWFDDLEMGGEIAARAFVAAAAATHVAQQLDRPDLPAEARAVIPRLAGIVAAHASGYGDTSPEQRQVIEAVVLAYRDGHPGHLIERDGLCPHCDKRHPAPGVTEHDDGSITWTHPTRGEITLPPPPPFLHGK